MIYYNYLGQPMPVSADPTTFVDGDSAGDVTVTAPVGPSGLSVNGGNYDTLIGSNGDNTFYVNNDTDVVQVAAGLTGVKTIVSYGGGYTLPANVQNLTFYGAGNWGAGNSGNNLIIMGGNDVNYMDGGGGNDVLVGGDGANHFGVTANTGSDVIYNFHASQDTVRLTGAAFTTFPQIQSAMTQVGPDVVLQVDPNDTLTFRDTTVASFQSSDFLLPLDTSLLGALTFDDEFNSLQLFNFSTGTGLWRDNFGGDPNSVNDYTIASNAEKEAYTDANFQGTSDAPLGFNPFSINDGVLTITAQNMGQESQYAYGLTYSSGMLNTKGIFMQQYGYFEMKAELPTGAGTWPAFWLSQDPYQPGTEADILEALGMYPGVDFARADDGGTVTASTYYNSSNLTGFHTYGLLWTPTITAFYVDGVAVMEMPTPASWDKPMYLIVDLAMGGWGGPVDEASLPAQMNIDYVRVYSLADGSSIVDQETPAGPAGTLTADGAAISLGNSGGWTDATMLADGQIVLVSSVDDGYGSHKANAMIYDPGSGQQIGQTVQLFGYANASQTMDPQVTALAGSFWEVTYAGTNAPQGFEIYNSQGVGVFFDNQYTVGTPVFTPLVTGGDVVTNGAWTQFAVVGADGSTNWYNDPTIANQPVTATEVHALTNGGFYFTYAGQQQIDVFDPTGAIDMKSELGAPISTFAMASAALPNGQFAVAWLSPPADNSFNEALTFQTFDSNGAALTAATTVATDADPWNTQMKVIATGPGDALLLWSEGGAVTGAYAHGSTIDAATPLIVGALDNTTQTALTDGHILLTYLQTDSGVQDLWSEILDPSTMTFTRQELGQADGGMSVVALANGAYAVSWHLGGQIEARGYDGQGHYGPTATVAGDFVASDSAGDVVAIYKAADGSAMLQHYAMIDYA